MTLPIRVSESGDALTQTPPRVLIIAGECPLFDRLRWTLELEGFVVEAAASVEAALRHDGAGARDLIILAAPDGVPVWRGCIGPLRQSHPTAPLLAIMGETDESDRILCLRQGADGVVSMPVGLLELLERVHALLRRRRAAARVDSDRRLRHAGIVLDPNSRVVFYHGVRVPLSSTQFQLLSALVQRRGMVASRAELLHAAGLESDSRRHLRAYISDLRRRITETAGRTPAITAVHRVGYRLTG